MGWTSHYELEITPITGKKKGIKRSIVEFIKKNDLPFIVHSTWDKLAKVSRTEAKDWQVTKIEAIGIYYKEHIREGLDWTSKEDNIAKLEPFLTDAVMVTSSACEMYGYDIEKKYFIFKDGKVVYKFSTTEAGIYGDVDYTPKHLMYEEYELKEN